MGRLDWRDLASVALVGLFLLSSGCATYSDRLVVARESAALGDYESGIAEMNRALSVASADEFPSDFAGDHTLAMSFTNCLIPRKTVMGRGSLARKSPWPSAGYGRSIGRLSHCSTSRS